MRYVLVLGGSHDNQVNAVVACLQSRGIQTRLVDYDSEGELNFELRVDRPAGGVAIELNGEVLPMPTVVWSRVKLKTLLGDMSESNMDEFVRRVEWRAFLFNLAIFFEPVSIYSYANAWSAESRLKQMIFAQRSGFEVPAASFFVGDKYARAMCQSFPKVVAKPLGVREVPRFEGDISRYRVLGVTDVDEVILSEVEAWELRCAPALFQERILSGVELRVLGFRRRSFTYPIKQRVETRVRADERVLYGGEKDGRNIYGAQYDFVETDPKLQSMIKDFLTHMALEYGAFDIIQGYDGKYYFIECNPEGQWYAANGYNAAEVAAEFASAIESRLESNS